MVELSSLVRDVDRVLDHYCRKYEIERNNEWFLLKIQEELGELVQVYLEINNKSRRRGKTNEELTENFQNEIIDLLCLVMSMASYNKVPIEDNVNEKWLKWIR
jgi:NTP pyrophosphatase (non-canonical NTP hydrolase)